MLDCVKKSNISNKFEFIHVNMDRTIYASKRLIERSELYSTKSAQAHEMMLQALTDIFLLTESDALIGHFLTNLSRLVIELSASKKGYSAVYFS